MKTDFPTASAGTSQAPSAAVEKSHSASHTEIRTLPNPLEIQERLNSSVIVIGIVELVRLALLRAHILRPTGLLAPVVALMLGWALQSEHRSAVVYVSSLVAVLATDDLPGLADLRAISAAKIVIGGEASFGAIFLGCALSMLFT